ncbi:hypothetical protein [Leptospira levettii]|uniref:hypothetical protein n=1 Tax=Leptospira levettii TaxID=2023178 RepID=UPI003EB7F485
MILATEQKSREDYPFEFFFSEVDDLISVDSIRDPLGTQIIWGYYGQKIFNNKLTTIANDIRNYSINLFIHGTRKRIKEEWQKHLFSIDFTKPISESIIIALENLVVYSILTDDDQTKSERGLLGIQRAKERIESTKNQTECKLKILELNLRNNGYDSKIKEVEILKRQISLGVHGRYKSPFIELKFFNKNLEYLSSINEENKNVWNLIESENFTNFNELIYNTADWILKHFIGKRKNSSIKIEFNTSSEELASIIQEIRRQFSKNILSEKLKNLWKNILNLNEDSVAGKLFDIILTRLQTNKDQKLENKTLFSDPTIVSDENIQLIIKLENSLCRVSYLFDYLLYEKTSNLEVDWLNKAEIQNKILETANYFREIEIHSNNSATKRLQDLKNIFLNTVPSDVLNSLLLYHNKIMQGRGAQPWITITGNSIQNNAFRIKESEFKKIKFGDWYHDYYISSLKSIAIGFLNS